MEVHTILDRHIDDFIKELRVREFVHSGQVQYLDPSAVKEAFLGPIKDAIQAERLQPITEEIQRRASMLLDELSRQGVVSASVRKRIDLDDVACRVHKVLAPRLTPEFKGTSSG